MDAPGIAGGLLIEIRSADIYFLLFYLQ